MIRVETYYTSDSIKFMSHLSGTTNVVVSDNKEELLKEIEWNILEQLEVGEFFGVMLIPEGVEGMKETKDIDNRLIKLKHDGTWYSVTPMEKKDL